MTLSALNRVLFLLSSGGGAGACEGVTRSATTYSLRRLGPTLADIFGLLLHERLPLGSWTAEGLSRQEQATAKAAAMPLTYLDSTAKLDSQRLVKTLVWEAVDKQLKSHHVT